jgi:hypothetical protein
MSGKMSYMRTALLGFALAVALGGGVARAQGDQGDQQLSSFQLMSNWVLVVTPDGRVTRRSDVPQDTLAEVMKDARPMTTGGIMFMRDNKLYMAPDRSMQGGTMLSDAIARPTRR